MTNTNLKLSTFCLAILAAATCPAMAGEDQYDDGRAAIYGQKMLQDWLQGPTAATTISRVTRAKATSAFRLGVEPGEYSVAEMAQIAAAKAEKHRSMYDVTMMKLNGERPMPRSHASQGEQGLAVGLGVDASAYSLSELAKMKFAADF